MESLKGFSRSGHCGLWRMEHAGQTVSVCGWIQRRRNLGGLIFADLRDRGGILQLAFDEATPRELFDKAATLHSEYVVAATGTLRERESKNPDLPTGDVELFVSELRILSEAETPPFEISDSTNAGEEVRLKYRYLDLRRPALQRNIILRGEIARSAREYFHENSFIEIETPMMIKSTPEGARDYIVPSRIHRGKFFALPQSPQIYKQLLMLAGFERYVQLARCFRDEDLRADRQPEFTQIDLEMSFVDVEDVLAMVEGMMQRLFRDTLGMDLPTPFPRLTYAEAMNRFGSDKPDLRFGMEIQDVSAHCKGTEFGLMNDALAAGGSVRCIVAKNAAETLTRKEIDKLTEHAKGIGAKGLLFVRWQDETPACSFGKFFDEARLSALCAAAGCERGDVMLLLADRDSAVLPILGALRGIVARRLNLIPEGVFNLLWVVEMPFFEWDEENEAWAAMHHPFTMPLDECLPYLETDRGAVRAKAYDLVMNGVELCSGSIRISDYKLQERMFSLLGLTKEQIDAKFGFLVDAYRYGAPPHGGVGLGLDRIAMILCGADNLRDVTAFPKVQNTGELMSACPGPVDAAQLAELGLTIAPAGQ